MTARKDTSLVSIEGITSSILLVRGRRVIVDGDLAAIYGVTTKHLNQAVKRNAHRFPGDFMFRLSVTEAEAVNRSQIATGSQKHRNPRFPPYAFTEFGAIQAANVVNSARAVMMGIHVVRAFVHLRDLLASNKELAQKFAELERKLDTHDQAITGILKTIQELLNPAVTRAIGFTANLEDKK